MGDEEGDAPESRARPGRHRSTIAPLIRRREHSTGRPRRRLPLPAPSPSALVGIAVLVLIGLGAIHLSGSGSAVPVRQEPTTEVGPAGSAGASADGGPASAEPDAGSAPSAVATSPSAELVVHVSGAVERPGVVRLPAGSRVADALRAAGGAGEEAQLAAINLARPLGDGEQIHVPVEGEEVPRPAPGAAAVPGEEPASSGAVIDLNGASAAQLEELPGVGPAIAGRIIEHRELNGPFESVDQLLEVSGIGPATLEELRERARV